MKKIKVVFIVVTICALALVLCACSVLNDAAKLQSYDFDNDSVPSITSVVGDRDVTGTKKGTGTDGVYQEYTYKTDSVIEDIQAYINKLQSQGWVITIIEDDGASSGTVQLGNESSDSGKIILLTIDYGASSYTLNIKKSTGTLNRF